jgi:hypothetical protein
MIKNLFFALALLVPGLAYSANPSADLTVQVVPGPPPPGIACAIGPNYTGPIPAGAQAAGYTTCAANYDFTNAAYSNVSSWLRCPDDGTPGYQWYYTYFSAFDCANVVMVTDGGTQTLQISFTTDLFTAGEKQLQLETQAERGALPRVGTSFPAGLYVESVWRYPASTFANAPANTPALLAGAPFMWCNNCSIGGASTPFVEIDPNEQYSNAGSTTIDATSFVGYTNFGTGEWNFGGAGNHLGLIGSGPRSSNVAGWDPTVYHTYSLRWTQNTSGNFAGCVYFDNTQLSPSSGGGPGCQTGTYQGGGSDPSITARYAFHSWTGWAQPNTVPTPTGPAVVLFRRMTVFTCATWQTTGCTGTIQTGNP